MNCAKCGHGNPADARFCGQCGARLVAACPSCGAENPPGNRFCGACGAPLGAAPPQGEAPSPAPPRHLAERILQSRHALEGERKQVTVLFADMKGSMELLADRDPEEARKLLDPVLERMMAAVHHYEGTVNQVMGDGIMALFGAPLAHEDHAVRACYAALRMQESVRRYTEDIRGKHGVEIQIRVGVNSGEVVVRSIGSDLRMDYTAVGQTTHLAARMEQLATPGTIRLTAGTLALAEGYVTVKPLGPVPVKGLAQPVAVFELSGAGEARTRLQVARARAGRPSKVGSTGSRARSIGNNTAPTTCPLESVSGRPTGTTHLPVTTPGAALPTVSSSAPRIRSRNRAGSPRAGCFIGAPLQTTRPSSAMVTALAKRGASSRKSRRTGSQRAGSSARTAGRAARPFRMFRTWPRNFAVSEAVTSARCSTWSRARCAFSCAAA